jgi:hypothetical protein
MISNTFVVVVFGLALFISLILLQNFIETINLGKDPQPNATYYMTWVCAVLWSTFFALQIQ